MEIRKKIVVSSSVGQLKVKYYLPRYKFPRIIRNSFTCTFPSRCFRRSHGPMCCCYIWWLNGLTFVGIISSVSHNVAWAAEIADANDYARTASIGLVEVTKR